MIDNILAHTEGWLFAGEANMLATFAQAVVAPNVIVEIGGYRGRSTTILGLSSKVPVYCIDPHEMSVGDPYPFGDEDREVWTRNILEAGLAKLVRPINLRSNQVYTQWDKPIGLLWIDGCHSYECVYMDLFGWLPHLSKDGIVMLHDVNTPPIAQAIDQFEIELVGAADISAAYKIKR